MGLQDPTSKMSKSATNELDKILLTDTPEEIMKKFKKAVTDSENKVRYDKENKPGVSNLMVIYGVIKNKSMEEIEKEFDGVGYGDFKKAVGEAVVGRLEPLQARYKELMEEPEKLREIYEAGDKRAREKTADLLKEVYQKVGLVVD